MNFLNKILRACRKSPQVEALQPLSSELGPIYAVADVHGCRKLLSALEQLIQTDAKGFAGQPQIVLLGDMIDRGPDTAGVLDDLRRPLDWGKRWALRGNHEAMMLDFVQNPQPHGVWLANGGYETLLSYGLALDLASLASLPRKRLGQMIAAHIPQDHLDFLTALPAGMWCEISGQTWVLAHAGYDEALGLQNQPLSALIWGHARPPVGPDIRLVQGHVPQEVIDLSGPVIRIDAKAYQSGRLCALRLVAGQPPKLISSQGPRQGTVIIGSKPATEGPRYGSR